MKSLRVTCLALAVLALPLAVRPAAALPAAGSTAAPRPETVQSRVLFYRLTAEQAAQAPGSLRFAVSVNGHPFA